MRAFAHDVYDYPLPPGHRFPLAKYRLIREAAERAGVVRVEPARTATREELLLAHDADYVDRLERGELTRREVLALGLPWSPQLVERGRRSVGATIEAATAALADGAAANLGGGTHHAFPDSGRGFCVFNDVVVALRALRAEGLVRRALVVDLDVHQGDGTHFALASDPNAVTASVNGFGNYPFQRVAGDVEVDLPNGSGDDAYLDAVERVLGLTLARGAADLCFYVAGQDPYAGDRLGRLDVSAGALATRDRLVRDALARAGVPVALSLAGGYADPIDDTVAIATETLHLFAAGHVAYDRTMESLPGAHR